MDFDGDFNSISHPMLVYLEYSRLAKYYLGLEVLNLVRTTADSFYEAWESKGLDNDLFNEKFEKWKKYHSILGVYYGVFPNDQDIETVRENVIEYSQENNFPELVEKLSKFQIETPI